MMVLHIWIKQIPVEPTIPLLFVEISFINLYSDRQPTWSAVVRSGKQFESLAPQTESLDDVLDLCRLPCTGHWFFFRYDHVSVYICMDKMSVGSTFDGTFDADQTVFFDSVQLAEIFIFDFRQIFVICFGPNYILTSPDTPMVE